jgi:hypothetical protein
MKCISTVSIIVQQSTSFHDCPANSFLKTSARTHIMAFIQETEAVHSFVLISSTACVPKCFHPQFYSTHSWHILHPYHMPTAFLTLKYTGGSRGKSQ